jgi:hypothetical protein
MKVLDYYVALFPPKNLWGEQVDILVLSGNRRMD